MVVIYNMVSSGSQWEAAPTGSRLNGLRDPERITWNFRPGQLSPTTSPHSSNTSSATTSSDVCCVLSHFSRVRLCNPTNCSPPGSSVHGILQARILEWIAIPFSRGSSWPKAWTQDWGIGWITPFWASSSPYIKRVCCFQIRLPNISWSNAANKTLDKRISPIKEEDT